MAYGPFASRNGPTSTAQVHAGVSICTASPTQPSPAPRSSRRGPMTWGARTRASPRAYRLRKAWNSRIKDLIAIASISVRASRESLKIQSAGLRVFGDECLVDEPAHDIRREGGALDPTSREEPRRGRVVEARVLGEVRPIGLERPGYDALEMRRVRELVHASVHEGDSTDAEMLGDHPEDYLLSRRVSHDEMDRRASSIGSLGEGEEGGRDVLDGHDVEACARCGGDAEPGAVRHLSQGGQHPNEPEEEVRRVAAGRRRGCADDDARPKDAHVHT